MATDRFELKPLSPDAVEAALRRALHYRYLNQPHLAESICRDVLAASPDDREARVTLVMSLCDQFGSREAVSAQEVLQAAALLEGGYERAYYSGLVCERKAEAALLGGGYASGPIAYDWFTRAMAYYQEAEPLRPAGNDDAILRWNTCARVLNTHAEVRPRDETTEVELLE
jgi:hypothetical protein